MHVLHRGIIQSKQQAPDVVIPECDALWRTGVDARETISMLLALLCGMLQLHRLAVQPTHTVGAEEDSSRYRTSPCFHQSSQSIQPVCAALSHQRHAGVVCSLSEPFGEPQHGT